MGLFPTPEDSAFFTQRAVQLVLCPVNIFYLTS